MKRLFAMVGLVAVALGAANSARANEYKSIVLSTTGESSTSVSVPDGRILEIRNFTQYGGMTRGTVTVTIGSMPPAIVLTAALLPADNMSTLEPINSIVIAGPATVAIACDASATTCFVSYRKEAE